FERGSDLEPVTVQTPLKLVVCNSGTPSSTRVMGSELARQHPQSRDRLEKIFHAIPSIVGNAPYALEAGDHRALGQLMDMNHALLSSLMVSTSRIEEICSAARAAGASGAKLTGAGGGGSTIALVK